MAETTQNKKKNKYGEREYYEDDVLKLHGAQLENYMEYARKRGQFDEASIAKLRSAIDNRINAFTSGQTFRGDGSLDTDEVQNITIQSGKKAKNAVNQDITEWAKYYLNTLINTLDPIEEIKKPEADPTAWNSEKYGYGAYLQNHGYVAQDVFEGMDKQNPNTPDAARGFSERDAFNLSKLKSFRDHITKQNYDFTKDDNPYNDDYINQLNDFIDNYNSYSITDKAAKLRYLGAGDWATAITSDRWDITKTAAQTVEDKKAADLKASQEQAAKKKAEHLKEWEDYAYANRKSTSPVQYRPYDYTSAGFSDFQSWYGDLNQKERLNYGTYLGASPESNTTWNNTWNSYIKSLHGGDPYTDANLRILLQGTFENQNHLFTDLGDGSYLINDSVTETGQGSTYNPKTGYVKSVFLGDLASSNDAIKKLYKQLGYNYLNKKYGTNYEDRTYVFKEGGEIPKYQQGSEVAFDWKNKEEVAKTKADKKGVSTSTQMARDNYMNKDNKSDLNDASGWNNAAKWRLSYAIADLGSAVASFFPVEGTAVAAVASGYSTIGNFATDLSDDAVTTKQAFSNLGLNVGMDLIGLIPGGGASTKLGKVVKGLKSTVPIIMTVPGVISMLANSPEIAQSWKKAFDGSSEDGGSKLDYQDYMNILQVLNVAAASVNIGTNKHRSKQVSTKSDKHVAVEVTDGNGKRKALVLEGEDATKFNQANSRGEAQQFISNLQGGEGLTIVPTQERNSLRYTGSDNKKHFQNPFGKHDTKTAITYEVKYDARKGILYADTGDSWRSPKDYVGDDLVTTNKAKAEAQWKRITGQLETEAKEYGRKTAIHRRNYETRARELDARNAELTKLQEDIIAATAVRESKQQALTNLETQRAGTGRQDAESAIAEARRKIEDKEASKAGIKSKHKLEAIDKEIADIQQFIAGKESYIDEISDENLSRAQQAVRDADTRISDLNVETARLQALLDRLNPHVRALEARIGTHSPAFLRRLNLKPITRNKFGRGVATDDTFTVGKTITEEELINAGLFKQGGSIDKTKLTKYLNYAKR